MYSLFFKRLLIAPCVTMILGLSINTQAELMLPTEPAKASNQPQVQNRLGGTIAKVDKKGLEINGVYYPFNGYGVKIHRMDGKLTRKSMLKPGMLVSVEVIKQSQTVKISEIWVIKDE